MAPTDGNTNSIEHSVAEPHASIQFIENSDSTPDTQNVRNDDENVTAGPVTASATRKRKCCLSVRPSSTTKGFCAFCMFTHVIMIIGILVVYFNTSKQRIQTCTLTYELIAKGEIQYNSWTRFAAVGDFNHDQHLDIAVANYGSDNVGVLLGHGDSTFASQTTYSSNKLSHPYAITVHDFNNDTRLDIAVINFGTNNLGIFLGYGNGTFETQVTLSTNSSRPIAITVGDFNNDSWLDVAIVNYGTNDVGILSGVGNGTFIPLTKYSTGYDSDPRALAVGDFNNDQRLDIVVTSFGTNNIGVLLGYGNGSFENLKIYSTGSGSAPYSVAVGDVNSDNRLDIIVANSGMDNVGVLLGYGNGTFASQTTFSTDTGSSPHSVTVGDFNNDNLLDIAVANTGSDSVGVIFGHGDGTFADQVTYSTGIETGVQFITIGDFNNDNRSDIVVANNETNNVAVLLSVRTTDFQSETTYSTGDGSYPFAVAVCDLNNDSRLDIVVANFYGNTMGVFLGYDDGTFGNQMTYSTDSGPGSLAVGDFNNDSWLDIVVGNYFGNNMGVFLGYGNGTFANQSIYSTGHVSLPNSVAVGDFNNDKQLDIVVANYGPNNIGIFLGYGNGTFADQITYSTDIGVYFVAVGDFNNDSRLDIVVANLYAFNINVFLGYGNGTMTNAIAYPSQEISYPKFVGVADVNNDFRLDVIVANPDRNTISVFLGHGDGTFADHHDKWTGDASQPLSLIAADFNKDNRMDIAVANSGSSAVCILQGHGDGTYPDGIMYSSGSNSPYSIMTGDFNKDDRLDIVVAIPDSNQIGVFLGYDAGKFNNPTEFSTSFGSLPSSLTIGDFNRDNQLDIAVSNYKSNSVGVFFGDGNATFTLNTTYFTGVNSQPRMIASADFNQDNILDVAVANLGIDSIGVFLGYRNGSFGSQNLYSTDPKSKPRSLAIGDFNNDNRSDLVVANSGTDNIGIFLGYDLVTLTSQTIFPLSGGVNFKNIATGDFNNDNRSDIVICDLDSSSVLLFLGYGNGTFESHKAYSTGEGSNPNSVVVGDFNHDNWLDMVVANYYPNNVGVLLGYGNGTFSNQTTYSTDQGPFFLAVSDFNKDNLLDIVVANLNSNNIGVFLGYGNGSFAEQTTYSTGDGSSPYSLGIGDFNNDNQLDIIVANSNANNVGIFIGYGNGTFENQITCSTGDGSNPYSVAVGDFNNDNHMDMLVAYFGTAYVAAFLGYGNGTFAGSKMNFVGENSNPMCVAVGDFNNDNRLDFVVTNHFNNFVGLWLGYGNGDFSGQYRVTAPNFFSPIFAATDDFNNDGLLDMALFDQYRLYVFLGSTVKAFLDVKTYSTESGSLPHSVDVGDFNNDDQMDIVVANYGNDNVGILLGLGYGVFENQTTYSTGNGSMPYSVAVGDFNNDTRLDIGVANYGTGNVGIFLGYGNGSFAAQTTYFTDPSSYPMSIVVGDVNNDTRLDIAIANYGSNYVVIIFGVGDGTFVNKTEVLMGYDALPGFVAIADVNNDTWLDIAVVNYGSGNIEVISKTC